jgi:hypothetical protein
LSVLAKGLIGIVLPALVVGPWLLVRGRWRQVLALLHPAGLVVFAVVALPWFVLMQQRYPGFYDYFIVEQHFRRFAQANFNNAHPGWFYVAVLPLLTLPWSVWLPWVVIDARRDPLPIDRARLGLYVWWIVAVVGFFSLPTSKLVGYVLPALAPWCLLIAVAAQRRPRAALATFVAGALVCVGVVVALAWKAPHSSRPAALALAAQMAADDRVVFVDEMFYDLPFYARLNTPPIVASDWADPAVPTRDNWRKELYDAARFDPARGRTLLHPLDRIGELACHTHAVWFVARPGNEARVTGVPGLAKVYGDRDVVLLRAPPRVC